MSGIYNTGTAATQNGSATVIGTGTGWSVALVTGGMFSAAGIAIPIASVDSDTELTLAYAWPGSNHDGAYAIARETSEAVRAAWINDRLAQVLARITIAGVTPKGAGTEAQRDALDPQPAFDAADPWIWIRLEPTEELAFSLMTDSGWSQWFPFPAGEDAAPFNGTLNDLSNVSISDPQLGDVLRKSAGDWVNHNASGWHAVGVTAGEATIDINDGDKFLITVDDDCELQVPANAVDGAPFAIRVVMDGAHSFTYAAGWHGENPPVLSGNGDETVLSGIVLDTGPTTAIINIVKAIPAT